MLKSASISLTQAGLEKAAASAPAAGGGQELIEDLLLRINREAEEAISQGEDAREVFKRSIGLIVYAFDNVNMKSVRTGLRGDGATGSAFVLRIVDARSHAELQHLVEEVAAMPESERREEAVTIEHRTEDPNDVYSGVESFLAGADESVHALSSNTPLSKLAFCTEACAAYSA